MPTDPSRAVVLATGLLSVFGFAVSLYLSIAHFAGSQILACADSGVVNCAKVTTSPQSVFLGVPVALLGLGFFVVALALFSPWAWHSRWRRLHQARLVVTIAALAFVLWLVAAELLLIGSICLWCTAAHLTTFALFTITVAVTPNLLATRE